MFKVTRIALALAVVSFGIVHSTDAAVVVDLNNANAFSTTATADETNTGGGTVVGDWGPDFLGVNSNQMFNFSNATNPADSVTWTVNDLTPGDTVDVYVSWGNGGGTNRVNDITSYTVTGGTGTVNSGAGLFNQDVEPTADLTLLTRPFQEVGTFVATGTSLSLTLTDNNSDDPGQNYLADAAAFVITPATVTVPTPAALPAGLAMLVIASLRRRRVR